jgi:LmbE family N-acetylglucosaminyl deacetylase
MKILAIGSHPDDIEAGCAGTLVKYAQQGHEIHLLIMTEGAKGGNAAGRRDEQLRAVEFLNPKSLTWGGYEDTKLTPRMNDMVHDIEKIMGRIDPDFIFVHYDDDTHQDHRALSKATVSATRYVRNVLFYEGPTSKNFSPTVFVDIGETIDRKVSMLVAHQSQVMKTNIEGLSIVDVIRATAMFRGIQGRVQFAEGFIPLRLFINI